MRTRLTVLLFLWVAGSSVWLLQIASSDPAPVAWAATNGERIRAWFDRYDNIRRTAQMSPTERKMADDLLNKKLGLLLPGFGRFAAHRLLRKMIGRYETAATAMKELPCLPETKELHEGYTRYFNTSRALFQDSVKALNNPLRSKKELDQRKQEVADLDETLKTLDKQLRDNYNIPPYSYPTASAASS